MPISYGAYQHPRSRRVWPATLPIFPPRGKPGRPYHLPALDIPGDGGRVHVSKRDNRYTSVVVHARSAAHDVWQSTGRAGCAGIIPLHSQPSLMIRNEIYHHRTFTSGAEVRTAVEERNEPCHNWKRPHTANARVSPQTILNRTWKGILLLWSVEDIQKKEKAITPET